MVQDILHWTFFYFDILEFGSSLEEFLYEFDDLNIDFDKHDIEVDSFDFEHKDFESNYYFENILVVEDEGHNTVEMDGIEGIDLEYNCS